MNTPKTSPARQRFRDLLATRDIQPKARPWYERRAEEWTRARGHTSPQATQAYFDALGRSPAIQSWQLVQAV